MAGLEEKASQRDLGKRKPTKIIIGDPLPSTSSFVKETTITLDPNVQNRGTGEKGVTMNAPTYQRRTTGPNVTAGMGGRRRGK